MQPQAHLCTVLIASCIYVSNHVIIILIYVRMHIINTKFNGNAATYI